MELKHRASILLRRARDILREQGLLHLIKRASLFFARSSTNYQSFYVYENNLNELSGADFTPKVQNFTLKMITAPQQIDELIAEGFDFSFAPNIVNFNPKRKLREASIENFNIRGKLSEEGILVCGFADKTLAYTNWIAMGKKGSLGHFHLKMDWQNEACAAPPNVNPEYRGLGINTCADSRIYQFIKEKGRAKVRGTTGKKNIARLKSVAKLGTKIVGEGRLFQILWWHHLSWKPYERVKQ